MAKEKSSENLFNLELVEHNKLSSTTKSSNPKAEIKTATAKSQYDDSSVQTLSALEHIRRRSGMYIGRLGDGSHPDDGIYILAKEVIDNSIDEFIMGYGNNIAIKISGQEVEIRDYGRGIPLSKIIECVSVINTGAKYNDDVFQFSVGLNGVGLKAVNALSQDFSVCSYREAKFAQAQFSQGRLLKEQKGSTSEADGTLIKFTPDAAIFPQYSFNNDYMKKRMFNYACLNRGLKLYLNGELFLSKKGLLNLLEYELQADTIYPIMHLSTPQLEMAFTHSSNYGETHFSFVNGQYTSDGGTHLSAFREGLLKGVNDFFKNNFNGQDVREGLVASIAVKIQEPIFESQTKNKLGNTDIRAPIVNLVRESVNNLLYKNTNFAQSLERKIINNKELREELAIVRKSMRAASKKSTLSIPQLKDSKYHRGHKKEEEKSMIFITEGQSATGSIISSRDVYYQAIYSLRGKPWNTFGKKHTEIYKNEELFNLMIALGIEQESEKLRYSKIILATDSDDDGYHIRNLILTFFLNFFEDLIIQGHVYILETPLFRVRNNKKTIYCYNKKERQRAEREIKQPEITRFKGLGEISPKEFAMFIGADMRIVPVRIHAINEVAKVLEFYMGKNTSERRDYIIENLDETLEEKLVEEKI